MARVRQGWREAEWELPAAELPRGVHVWCCRKGHSPGVTFPSESPRGEANLRRLWVRWDVFGSLVNCYA